MRITVHYPIAPQRPSVHASLVADHFGLAGDMPPHVVAEDLELQVEPETIVAFTGPSGSGKSSLLRAAVAELERGGAHVVRPDDLPLPELPVIDALGVGFEQAVGLLSSCGLAEPRLMLRRPVELSDGERWRFRLAMALAKGPQWVVADEFTAALDRTLAKVVAFNVRRQCDRGGVGFLVATCHEDVLEDLRPEVCVRCEHDGGIEVVASTEKPLGWASTPERDAQGAAARLLGSSRAAAVHGRPTSQPFINNPAESRDAERRDVRSHAERGTEFRTSHQSQDTKHRTSWSASPTNSKSPKAPRRTGRTSLGGITGRTGSGRCGS